jgi:tetratricopeptide (TPR) repeat protein
VGAPHQAIRTEDIHRQLERICASEAFRRSLRLTRFLTFVVETTLAGNSATIKAYTIAVEVLGRGVDFDADRNPIVRVEAGRLRRALARYYAEAGSNDSLMIELPRGAYVPSFRSLAAQQTPTELPFSPQPSETPRESATTSIGSRIFGIASAAWRPCSSARAFRIIVYAVAILAFLEVLFDIDRPFTGGPNEGLLSKLWPAGDAAAARSFAVTGEPVIYVEPAMVAGDRAMATSSARMIRERLFDALTRYDDVAVLTDEPHDGPAASAAQAGGKAPPHYHLSSAISHYSDGAFTLVERVMETAEGTVLWARTYERDSEYDPNNESGLALITRDVAQTLLQQFGVIQARETIKRAHADGMHDSYRCVLDANIYLRSFDPSLYKSVRGCLEHAAGDRHPLVGVFVKLARLYYRDYQLGGADGVAGDRAKLDRAYQMAARAIDVKSTSATAQFATEEILLARGDFEQAKIASENSLRLNPYDNAVIFGRASFLILTGQLDDGLAVLRQNTTKQTVTWTGYHFLGTLGSYLKGDLTTAQVEAGQIASENFPFGLMLDAIVAAKSNNSSRAQHDIAMLYAKYPSWRHNVRANVGYFLPNHDMADRIAEDFSAVATFVQLADKPAFSERE